MGFYSRHVMPTIVACGCSLPAIAEQRARSIAGYIYCGAAAASG